MDWVAVVTDRIEYADREIEALPVAAEPVS